MKKIYTTKPNTSLVPQPRSFSRRIKQMFANILKYQDPEVIERLQNLEHRVEMMTRAMARQPSRKR
jgi:hypothetical protein